ncbi:MAG: glycosyltransferase family A protein [Nitrospirota bacterium]
MKNVSTELTELDEGKCAPVFSIIIPVLNRVRYLPGCLKSVQSQTYSDYEIVVIDNGSTDGSYELAMSLAQEDARIKLVREPRRGLAFARNRGIVSAGGKWLILLDSDNQLFDKFTLSRISSIIADRPEAIGLLTNSVDQNGVVISGGKFSEEAVSLKDYLSHFGEMAHVVSGSWFRKNLYPEVEGAVTEFPWLVWIPMVLTKKVYAESVSLIRYSTATEGSIGNSRTSVKWARDMTRYYSEILKRHGKQILLAKPSVAIKCLLKLLLYARAAGAKAEGGVVLSPAENVLSKVVFVVPPQVAIGIIDRWRGVAA